MPHQQSKHRSQGRRPAHVRSSTLSATHRHMRSSMMSATHVHIHSCILSATHMRARSTLPATHMHMRRSAQPATNKHMRSTLSATHIRVPVAGTTQHPVPPSTRACTDPGHDTTIWCVSGPQWSTPVKRYINTNTITNPERWIRDNLSAKLSGINVLNPCCAVGLLAWRMTCEDLHSPHATETTQLHGACQVCAAAQNVRPFKNKHWTSACKSIPQQNETPFHKQM